MSFRVSSFEAERGAAGPSGLAGDNGGTSSVPAFFCYVIFYHEKHLSVRRFDLCI